MKTIVVKCFLVVLSLLFVCQLSYSQQIVINEVMYDNKDILFDKDGKSPDWIELYNPSGEPVNLKGFQLTDDTTETDYWTFPDYMLAPESFLLVFASGKDRKDANEFHTDFKLGLMKDPLFLIAPNGEILSSYEVQCVPANLSLGYLTDGFGELHVQKPSPGKPNSASEIVSINYQPDAVSFSNKSGFYATEFSMAMTNSQAGNEIRYTLDGTEPEMESPVYETPILIKNRTSEENIYADIKTSDEWRKPGNNIFKATVVRAMAYSEGCPASEVVNSTYFVHPQIKEKYKVPVVSIITDPDNLFDKDDGIYVKGHHVNYHQHGKAWERDAHIEYWDNPEQKILSQNIGIRINGAGSRAAPQKTLRLYARNKYGKEFFEHPFFKDKPDVDKFKTLLLRASVDWTGSLFVDALCHDLVKDMDVDYQSSQTVVVFINGEYWGIHSLRERQDVSYIQNNYKTSAEDFDIIAYAPNNGPTVSEGSLEGYNELISYLESNDLKDEYNYEQACDMVDVSNLMDYYIAQLFLANSDFPNNNFKLWREKDGFAKWRTFFFDFDRAMIRTNYEHLTEYTTEYESFQRHDSWATIIFRSFLKNEQFRKEFTMRYYSYLNKYFRPDVIIGKIDEYEKLYQPLMAEHTYRWHQPVDVLKWKENVDMLRLFALQRPVVVNKQLGNLLETPFTIFPNPTTSGFNIENLLSEDLDIGTQIFSIDGKLVYSKRQEMPSKGNCYVEPELKNGLYLVKINYGDFSFVLKLIKM